MSDCLKIAVLSMMFVIVERRSQGAMPCFTGPVNHRQGNIFAWLGLWTSCLGLPNPMSGSTTSILTYGNKCVTHRANSRINGVFPQWIQ